MSVWRGPPALLEEAPTAFEGSYRVDSMCGLRKDVRGLLYTHPFSLGGLPS